MFEHSILIHDRPAKSLAFLASVSLESLALSLAILIPLAQTNHLPDFHWKSLSVAAPPRPLAPAPVVQRSSNTTLAGPVYSRRVFTFTPTPTSIGNRTDSGETFSVEPPGPIGFAAPSSAGGIEIDKFITMPAVPRLSHLPAITPPPPAEPLRVGGDVQRAKLVKKVIPEYPALAKTARVSGVVHLLGVIAKDGTIQNLQLISGHPLLARAAMEAVRKWVYEPTLLNGQPVEVIAPIDVNFTLGL
jgi:protein TonB